ncbi:MAG: hypothetical protein R3362_02420 [Rhodothermales bacterium]|nr:hypothetical protein [Rhodothermales bacterium]
MIESLPEGVQADEVRATIDDLEAGLHQLPLSKAVNRIDDWQRILRERERDDLAAIADGLEELHRRLTGPDLSAYAIGKLLVRLGKQTGKVAETAEREDVRQAVARLGDLLFHAGHALRGPRAPESNEHE